MSRYELADGFWCKTRVGIVTIEPDIARASEWMFLVEGKMVGHAYYSAEELADRMARHQTGEPHWDDDLKHVNTPPHLSEWIRGCP